MYSVLFYIVDVGPGVIQREQQARSARHARGGQEKNGPEETPLFWLFRSPQPPQNLTDKYQRHNKTAAILKHAGADSNNSC